MTAKPTTQGIQILQALHTRKRIDLEAHAHQLGELLGKTVAFVDLPSHEGYIQQSVTQISDLVRELDVVSKLLGQLLPRQEAKSNPGHSGGLPEDTRPASE